MHRLSLPALLLASVTRLPLAVAHPLAASLTAATDPDYYGHWDVFYARGNAASGYRWVNLSANYSGTPETTVSCKQLYDPNVNETTSSCDDASFSYEVDEGWPESWITLRQTVQLGVYGTSMPVTITGKSLIEIGCGKGAAGRACEGSARVEAGQPKPR